MADKLTPQQRLAVENRGGRLLVSAAAGSGKTKVLVDRLMGYLTDPLDPANLDEFLIITYTKAAASELRVKIAAKLSEKIAEQPGNRHLQKQMQRLFLTKISTVHGFCGDLLREYAYKLDLSGDFRIADETECREMRDRVMGDLLEQAYQEAQDSGDFRRFVDTQGLGRNDRLIPEIVEKVYDSSRCHMDPENWLNTCLTASASDDCPDIAQTIWGQYLMEDLKDYALQQVQVFQAAIKEAQVYPEFDKVSANLRATQIQLEAIAAAESWDSVIQNKNIDYGRLVFPRKNPAPEVSDRVKAIRNACKKGMEKKLQNFTGESAEVAEDLKETLPAIRGLLALVQNFGQQYTAAKRSRRCMDFADLEHHTLTLLLGKSRSGPTAAAGEIAQRYREIMVDEYQDSNGVQDAIFTVLTQKKHNCFLVGDVKQSIYQFRLADPGIFLEKYHSYLPADQAGPGQGRKILLSHNFRSGCEIVEAVNEVFSSCMRPKVGGLHYGDDEMLREGIPHSPLPDPAVELYAIDVKEESYPEEAEFVAQRIRQMLDNRVLIRDTPDTFRPVQPEDIVILLRSPGSGSAPIIKALEARGIRCTTGAGTDLLHTQEVATLRSLLQIILNPRQDIPLVSTLASPVFGFTADQLATIRSRHKKGSFFDALAMDDDPRSVTFLQTLESLRQCASMCSLTELLEACYCSTRLDSIFRAMPGGTARDANLQSFFQLVVDYENGCVRDLSQFLDHLNALESKGYATAAAPASGCVTVMSIHKSKGLEFPVVFLCNLSRKFNQEDLRGQILCDKTLGLGLNIADIQNRVRYPSVAKRAISVKMAAQNISEEMRVLYVALTRARDRLIMTYASRSLAADLQDIALRSDFDGGELVCREAGCMGDWILRCALGKTEAGELHAIGDRPCQTKISDYPWRISVVDAPAASVCESAEEEESRQLPENLMCELKNSLAFQYPYQQATTAPSKQTATDRKGRPKDDEAIQDTDFQKKTFHTWRKPSFISGKTDPAAYGNAMHRAMQYLHFDKDCTPDGIQRQIQTLTQHRLLSEEQAAMVQCDKLSVFFRTEPGQKLTAGVPHIREFKFSILDNGSHYGSGLDTEQVLLQGVVDCALLEEDGITILDFKTDRITGEQITQTAERYRSQLDAYAHALSRIYRMPVKAKYLYFFQLDLLFEL